MSNEAKCPFNHAAGGGTTNRDWWPSALRLDLLNQHSSKSDPLGANFDYAAEFKKLDYFALKKDLLALMTDSQDWWPADFGHYGPQFVRMAWHAAGTYRTADGRGGGGRGQQRFAPLNSWPDNVNIDKSRRLLWPIKQKYGQQISWADLLLLAGNVALESMGFRTFGFAGGRADVWEPDQDVNWGSETTWLATDKRFTGDRDLDQPLAATHMGLIYVNPEGPNASGDALAAAKDIRATFGRMAMDDEEIVALIAGGHTFGKAHGAAPESHKGPEPEGAPLEAQGPGLEQQLRQRPRQGHRVQRPGGHLDDHAGALEQRLLRAPVQVRVGADPLAGRCQAVGGQGRAGDHPGRPHPRQEASADDADHRPDAACRSGLREDLAALPRQPAGLRRGLRTRLVQADPPRPRPEGALPRPRGAQGRPDLAGPFARGTLPAPSAADIAEAKAMIAASGLTVAQLVATAWASASTFRGGDKRGGANGARIRLAPQKGWEANTPGELAKVLGRLESIQKASGKLSLADVIVLAGGVGVEQAAKAAGVAVEVPFTPGRVDATQAQTDVESFGVLEPVADGFRNYFKGPAGVAVEHLLVDKAQQLTLTAPEMTVLVGGLRVLDANAGGSRHGVFTDRPGVLSTDFFTQLLDMGTQWKPAGGVYEGQDRRTGAIKWTARRADLVFGSNAVLRALAEVYASADAKEKFVHDFVAAWTKVMNLDRHGLA